MSLEAVRLADLTYMLEDAGVRCRAGSSWTWGIFDTQGENVLEVQGGGAGVMATVISLTIKTGELTLAIGGTVETEDVNGTWTSYVVRDFSAIADGALTRYLLAEA